MNSDPNATDAAPAPAPAPDPSRPLLPPLPAHMGIPRRVKVTRPLLLSAVHAIAMWWRELGTVRGVARMTGITAETVRAYVQKGDPSRSIPPLRLIAPDDLPPLPARWKRSGGVIPLRPSDGTPAEGDEEQASPLAPEGQVLGALPAPASPNVSTPATVPPSQSSGKAPSVPPGASLAALTPTDPEEPPEGPPAGQQEGGAPEAAPSPGLPVAQTVPGVPVGHTLGVANAEIVRLSRNTRALMASKVRALAVLSREAASTPLTKVNKGHLMVLREIRLTARDVAQLYVLERDILGVGQGAGVVAPERPEEREVLGLPPSRADRALAPAPFQGGRTAESLEEIMADVRALLGENPNLAPHEPGSPAASPYGGMPVTVQRSVLDLTPAQSGPPLGGANGGNGHGAGNGGTHGR